MIRILAREYSQAVALLCAKLDKEAAPYDVYFTQSAKLVCEKLAESAGCDGLILVGDTWNWCNVFAETFGLALVYDKFAEKNIREYCRLSGTPVPAQYVMDKYCVLPETFIHYAAVFGMQCGCGGEFGKCHVYILPDDAKECEVLFDNYLHVDLFKVKGGTPIFYFKLFGLSRRDLQDKLAKINSKFVLQRFETTNLDSKVTLIFAKNCAKKVIGDYLDTFKNEFQGYIYANADKTLAQTVVSLLNERYRTVAVAESITGGLITSSIVDVSGASSVLYEGAVTYSIDAKCKRLGLNPHFIDEYGVVSAQVAKEMALAQLKNANFSVATTGFAGPEADGVNPVGLCYIGIGAELNNKHCVKVFKNIFHGDRNSIRSQVANTALYLLISAISNQEFFSTKNNIGENR